MIERLRQDTNETDTWGRKKNWTEQRSERRKAATQLQALAARMKQKDAALRLFLALVDDPDYDFGELCEEFVPIASAALKGTEQ